MASSHSTEKQQITDCSCRRNVMIQTSSCYLHPSLLFNNCSSPFCSSFTLVHARWYTHDVTPLFTTNRCAYLRPASQNHQAIKHYFPQLTRLEPRPCPQGKSDAIWCSGRVPILIFNGLSTKIRTGEDNTSCVVAKS